METKIFKTIDGNEAVAHVTFRVNEVIAIYPITPSSPMGELADAWASEHMPNLWGIVPTVVEMQSEGGAAGAVHGALQAGALTTTFTSSQGLLLMIPNMYKIAGELTATVFHVAARTVAAHALSIFGDHSDVMATRATGFALLGSASVQEAMDFALISQAATLKARIPFLHFFDGFRTSHEVSKIALVSEEVMRALIDEELILAHRRRALSPDHPVLRGTAQNPDVFFQARETVNPYYLACPAVVQEVMDQFARLTGRQYRLFEYHGSPTAERVIILMGSGCETAHETVDYLNARGENVGVLKVRLYRPFDVRSFLAALPQTVKAVAVLDRTKEPGSAGEPLYLDCVNALHEGMTQGWRQSLPKVIGGRYGLSSKEFTPAMVKGLFDHLAGSTLKNHFTLGIQDDVTHTSLPYDPAFSTEPDNVIRALFYGLGSDGTVSANKNSIKIIGEHTDHYAQGYFVYDSKKAGAVTVSHLRFGPQPIRSTYLISRPNFVACHQPVFLERYDMLTGIMEGGTFLLNSPHGPEEVWGHLPRKMQEDILRKKLKFYVIDATRVARESGMGGRINTVMQVCFFALSGVLPREEAIAAIKQSVVETYGKKGEEIVRINLAAVDRTLAHLYEVKVPANRNGSLAIPPPPFMPADPFVRDVLGAIIAGRGDELPVSALPVDGTFPTGTAKWEKRNLALEIPVWEPDICIQCGKCAMVCPHAVIRIKAYEEKYLAQAPATFKACDARDREWQGLKYTIQVAPEDCTGCALCVDVCPAKKKSETRIKAINMRPQPSLRETERKNWEFFLTIPEMDRRQVKVSSIRQQQVQEPLFEFSGACAGCGETPYIKLLTQLFGDRALVANATGCSSIYGGNLPTTPWTKNAEGRGPAWSNSLFEDNAEFGLGFRLAIDKQREMAAQLLQDLSGMLGDDLVNAILGAPQKDEADIYEQRMRVDLLKKKLQRLATPEARRLLPLADALVRKSVWIIGGDGWAYDIGFGGLDHVLASGRDVNVLVLDTEVYSNTGGQMSKATPRGAVAKFAAGGKPAPKKDLGLIAMTYGNVYVARVAMGARDEHTLRAFLEAEAYEGPSLIIAYSHCIAHGINMATAMQNQKAAVEAGQWLLYRYHPERAKHGENPLTLDSPAPKLPLDKYFYMENRFKILTKSRPEDAKRMLKEAQEEVNARWKFYEYLAARPVGNGKAGDEEGKA
ncbi:MAG: pyruvate:ferredoxin (flavodoxin) oxidoreductase [candidate division KSB1 bacterium]|nr:pyruvate:ferredoxin (flavodoxin) oxidoreductase [candidate division KSB1 bacterium]MDZ7274128.1 pyruvate:ferredoxin (flavodoxin) oxidoreductase [candidate division KSB1 bacterium]MDZ7287827.1 pyruvate:ferredoxin (flavodoxin) oxidoreductase [candidate division KSB1 bacterium]MDZ7296727.1 pyruvate:ferredoxin (flavodoxin) oxidoreductase [candidate division KSB1 bacterium]MDZ7307717.1 pyruvate:ferredoxin (flavodoxin) oxidoreductase [candidate division KSB1 bacterium]